MQMFFIKKGVGSGERCLGTKALLVYYTIRLRTKTLLIAHCSFPILINYTHSWL